MRKWSRATGPTLIGSALVVATACGTTPPHPGFANPHDAGGGGSDGSGGAVDSSMSSSDDSGPVGSFGDGSTTLDEAGFVGDAGCATATATATQKPVYLLFILDGSDSMMQNNKWPAATQALEAIFADMQTKADPGIGAGLIVFSDTLDKTGATGPYPEPAIDVPIDFVDATQDAALNARLAGMPKGVTPTGAALQGGYGELESYTATTPLPPGGEKVLVLITDGVPTKNGTPVCAVTGGAYTTNACVVEAGQEDMKAPPTGPILTFVIGTGVFPSADLTNFDPSFLGSLAQAGGSGPTGCNPTENASAPDGGVPGDLCYFEVDPTLGSQTQTEQAFEAAINAIRGQVLSCTFPLSVNSEAGTLDPTKVNVTVDGMTLPQSATNGWSYDNPTNPTEIIFNGPACDNIKSEPMATVQIVLGCATINAQ